MNVADPRQTVQCVEWRTSPAVRRKRSASRRCEKNGCRAVSHRQRIPAEIERAVLTESGHRCAVCGESCPLERAHIIPWHRSKAHLAADLVCLCANCHARADLEKWGELTLRTYKLNPWVLRKTALQTPIGQGASNGPTGDTRRWAIPSGYTEYLSACRRVIEDVDIEERLHSHRDSAPILCPSCFRDGDSVEAIVTEKSQYIGGGGLDGTSDLDRRLHHACPKCGTVVRGFVSILSIHTAVPRLTLPNLSKRLRAAYAYTSRLHAAVRENDDEEFSSALSLWIWERLTERRRVEQTDIRSREHRLSEEWYASPINCHGLLQDVLIAQDVRSRMKEVLGQGVYASMRQPTLCSMGLDAFLSTTGFYRDAWDEITPVRKISITDTFQLGRDIRCADYQLSRVRRLLRGQQTRAVRLVLGLRVEEWVLTKCSNELWTS